MGEYKKINTLLEEFFWGKSFKEMWVTIFSGDKLVTFEANYLIVQGILV